MKFPKQKFREFVFLYPIPEIINHEIKNHSYGEEGGIEAFKEKYARLLNECIDLRYRKKNFGINFVTFTHHDISELIEVQPGERILDANMYFDTHVKCGVYPDNDYILDELISPVEQLVITGFHMWDCVSRLAKRAYKRKINVLVDEDLTEFFSGRIKDKNFRTDVYPTFNPREMSGRLFDEFLKARENKPWLWQDY